MTYQLRQSTGFGTVTGPPAVFAVKEKPTGILLISKAVKNFPFSNFAYSWVTTLRAARKEMAPALPCISSAEALAPIRSPFNGLCQRRSPPKTLPLGEDVI